MIEVTERRFGVEVECGCKVNYVTVGEKFREAGFKDWSIGCDGSGVEARSPILKGAEGISTLGKGMKLLLNNGGYVTRADGMHVHHDAPEFIKNPENILRLVHSWLENQDSISAIVSPMRRSYGCCPRWTPAEFERLKSWAEGKNPDLDAGHYYGRSDMGDGPYIGRKNLNVSSIAEHGSIEIRLHEGCLDIDTAAAWIAFGQRFIDKVLASSKPMTKLKSPNGFLKKLALNADAVAHLENKVRTVKDNPDRPPAGTRDRWGDEYH